MIIQTSNVERYLTISELKNQNIDYYNTDEDDEIALEDGFYKVISKHPKMLIIEKINPEEKNAIHKLTEDHRNMILRMIEQAFPFTEMKENIYYTLNENDCFESFISFVEDDNDDDTEYYEVNILDLYIKINRSIGIPEECSNIKAYRLHQGLTIQELANKMSILKQNVHRWEQGTKPNDKSYTKARIALDF